MTEIEQYIEEIILQLKEKEELSGIKFFRSYKEEKFQTPVTEAFATVNLLNFKTESIILESNLDSNQIGQKHSGTFKICVYSPCFKSEKVNITTVALNILKRLNSCNKSESFSGIEVLPLKFEQKQNTMCRSILVSFVFQDENSVQEKQIEINGVRFKNLIFAEIKEENEHYEINEIFQNIPLCIIKCRTKYIITLETTDREEIMLLDSKEYDVKYLTDCQTERYLDCKVEYIKEKYSRNKEKVFSVKMFTYKKEVDDA